MKRKTRGWFRKAITRMLTITGRSRLDKNFKVDQAHRHEPQRQPRHEPSKQHQQSYNYYTNEKLCFAATILYSHFLLSCSSSSSLSFISLLLALHEDTVSLDNYLHCHWLANWKLRNPDTIFISYLCHKAGIKSDSSIRQSFCRAFAWNIWNLPFSPFFLFCLSLEEDREGGWPRGGVRVGGSVYEMR